MVQCGEFDWVGIPDGDWLNGRAWPFIATVSSVFDSKSNVVKYFVKQWRMDASVGKMFKCTLAWTQLSVGVSYPQSRSILLPDYRIMEVKWLAFLKTFLSTMKAGELLDEPSVAHLQRHGDSCNMNHILEVILRPTSLMQLG